MPKPAKKVIEKGHPEEWPMILPQVIHHERAVKYVVDRKSHGKSLPKKSAPKQKLLDKSIAAARDVVQPGLHVGHCVPHEVLFISSCHSFSSVTYHADTGHFYLSLGITHINGVPVIQKTSQNELNHEEQKEF